MNRNKFISFFFTGLFLFINSGFFAQTISTFKFEGLKKTKPEYLEKVLERFNGQEANENTLHDIETCLQAEGLFETIELQCDTAENEEEAVITVTLKEKITFIPLPFAYASNDSWMAGGMILNMNAFGTKTLLMSGGFFSTTMINGIFGISKPAANKKDFGYSVFTSASRITNEHHDIYDEEYLKYVNNTGSLSLSVSKKITDFTLFSLGTSGTFKSFSEADDEEIPFENDRHFQLKAKASMLQGTTDWNDWFLNTNSFAVEAEGGHEFFENENFYQVSGAITVQYPVIKRFRLTGVISGVYSDNLPVYNWNGGGSAAVTILPSKFSSTELYGGNAGFEAAVKKFNFGLLSIYSNYQAVFCKNIDDEYKFCHGPSGGVRLYLSKIAFPAFAFGISRNITTSSWEYSISLGVSF